MRKKILFLSLVVMVLLAALSTNYAEAKPFYQNKTMSIIVATKPGGGYDYYGRLASRFMQKYMPGSSIIVKNIPGAGHIIGANEIYTAKPNGLTFGTFTRGLPVSQLAELRGIKFDLVKMSWLGSPCSETYSFIVNKKFKTVDDVLKADKVRLATSGRGTADHITTLLFELMTESKNFKVVPGYGGGEGEMAIMRGEIEGLIGSWDSVKGFVEEGFAHPVMFIGKKQPKEYENIPLIQEIITEEKHKPLLKLLLSINVVGRPFAGPPGIPKDRIQILRNAFEKAFHDPELVALAKKTQRKIDFMSPDETFGWIKSLLESPPQVAKIVKQSYGIQ